MTVRKPSSFDRFPKILSVYGMTEPKNKKDDTYWAVLNSALELEFRKGHLKWTISELSRSSKITRTLIYYYFGQSKLNILQAAVNVIGEEFVGIGNERQKLWAQGEFEKSLTEARQFYNRAPFLCAFYLNNRNKDNPIGKELIDLEKQLMAKIKKIAPKSTTEQINTIFAVYFGIAFSPNVGPKEIKIFADFISGLFQKLK